MGEIVKRYERIGLKLIGLKLMVPSEEMIEKHYTLDPGMGESYRRKDDSRIQG